MAKTKNIIKNLIWEMTLFLIGPLIGFGSMYLAIHDIVATPVIVVLLLIGYVSVFRTIKVWVIDS